MIDLKLSSLKAVLAIAGLILGGRLLPAGGSRPLANADLSGQQLRAVRWTRANLHNADLQYSALCGSDLRSADCSQACFFGATLRGADLQGADLSWSDLCGTDMSGARLEGVRLDHTVYDRETRWPVGFRPEEQPGLRRRHAPLGRRSGKAR